jgi:hypothetical protein
MQIANKK